MEFIPIPCHESLRPFIRNYWMLCAQCTATGTQQIFSNGAASLQFYLSQDIRIDDGDKQYRTILFHQNMQKIGIVTTKGTFDVFGAEFVPICRLTSSPPFRRTHCLGAKVIIIFLSTKHLAIFFGTQCL